MYANDPGRNYIRPSFIAGTLLANLEREFGEIGGTLMSFKTQRDVEIALYARKIGKFVTKPFSDEHPSYYLEISREPLGGFLFNHLFPLINTRRLPEYLDDYYGATFEELRGLSAVLEVLASEKNNEEVKAALEGI
jgi:hypothetical protein